MFPVGFDGKGLYSQWVLIEDFDALQMQNVNLLV